ncbi:unnamed protein product [Closterium sp. NIES-54]
MAISRRYSGASCSGCASSSSSSSHVPDSCCKETEEGEKEVVRCGEEVWYEGRQGWLAARNGNQPPILRCQLLRLRCFLVLLSHVPDSCGGEGGERGRGERGKGKRGQNQPPVLWSLLLVRRLKSRRYSGASCSGCAASSSSSHAPDSCGKER